MECIVPVFGSPWEIRRRFPAIAVEQNPGKAIQLAFNGAITDIHRPGSQAKDGECPACVRHETEERIARNTT